MGADKASAEIIVSTKVVGFHRWPDAPPEVGYLAQKHRHIFTIKAAFFIDHDDRDLEYHKVIRDVRAVMRSTWSFHHNDEFEFGHHSAEYIARQIGRDLRGITQWRHEAAFHPYDEKLHWVEVWEDDECGSRVTFKEVRS